MEDPGAPSIMAEIATYLGDPPEVAAETAQIAAADFQTPYIEAISKFADLDVIAKSGLKFAIDTMYGSGRGVISGILTELGVDHIAIRSEVNPLFPGINPEPIEPHIRALQEAVVANHCQAGLATDGDADRLGAVDEHGNFVDPHKIFSHSAALAGGAEEMAGRRDPRLQHHQHDRPHLRQTWPEAL